MRQLLPFFILFTITQLSISSTLKIISREKIEKQIGSAPGLNPGTYRTENSGFKAPSVGNPIRLALYMQCSLWYAHDIEWLSFYKFS